jgi:hypothetical protein
MRYKLPSLFRNKVYKLIFNSLFLAFNFSVFYHINVKAENSKKVITGSLTISKSLEVIKRDTIFNEADTILTASDNALILKTNISKTIVPDAYLINNEIHSDSEARIITNSTSDVIISIDCTTTNAGNSTSLHSNPSNNSVFGTISDLTGKKVYITTFTVNTKNALVIKLYPEQKLIKGMYFVTLLIKGEKITKKLLVQ